MPKFADTKPERPFARVLTEFMWQQRPPWTTGKVARRLGLSRQTVANWLYNNVTPSVETMFGIMAELGISLERLIEAYAQAGVPIPPRETPPADQLEQPQEKPYEPQQSEPAPDPWETMLDNTRTVLAELAMDPEEIEAVLQQVQETRQVRNIMRRHILAEHASTYTEDDTQKGANPPRRRRSTSQPR